MKIIFYTIGKPHDKNLSMSITDFTTRLQHYYPTSWHIIQPIKNAQNLLELDLKKVEGNAIIDNLQKDDWVVLLDETGKQISSVDFANLIQKKANESIKRLVFIIGGAYGVDETVLKRANYVLGLSNLVFPHMIVRLLLAEQVYRAATILKNEKYHHL
jgi:23S rRNA (pseudouridine1915-N3)-methyltransferase